MNIEKITEVLRIAGIENWKEDRIAAWWWGLQEITPELRNSSPEIDGIFISSLSDIDLVFSDIAFPPDVILSDIGGTYEKVLQIMLSSAMCFFDVYKEEVVELKYFMVGGNYIPDLSDQGTAKFHNYIIQTSLSHGFTAEMYNLLLRILIWIKGHGSSLDTFIEEYRSQKAAQQEKQNADIGDTQESS